MPYNLAPALPLPMPLKLAPMLPLLMPLNLAPTLLLPKPLNLTPALPLPLKFSPALPLPMSLNLASALRCSEAPGMPNWGHAGKEYCYTVKNHSNETMRDYLRHRKPLTGSVGS